VISLLLLWIVGVMTKQQEHHLLFQANTIRHRNVLSTFTIGWQCLKRKQQFYVNEFFEALENIKMMAQQTYVDA